MLMVSPSHLPLHSSSHFHSLITATLEQQQRQQHAEMIAHALSASTSVPSSPPSASSSSKLVPTLPHPHPNHTTHCNPHTPSPTLPSSSPSSSLRRHPSRPSLSIDCDTYSCSCSCSMFAALTSKSHSASTSPNDDETDAEYSSREQSCVTETSISCAECGSISPRSSVWAESLLSEGEEEEEEVEERSAFASASVPASRLYSPRVLRCFSCSAPSLSPPLVRSLTSHPPALRRIKSDPTAANSKEEKEEEEEERQETQQQQQKQQKQKQQQSSTSNEGVVENLKREEESKDKDQQTAAKQPFPSSQPNDTLASLPLPSRKEVPPRTPQLHATHTASAIPIPTLSPSRLSLLNVLSCILEQLCPTAVQLPSDTLLLSMFHTSSMPAITIRDYLHRLVMYTNVSEECCIQCIIHILVLAKQGRDEAEQWKKKKISAMIDPSLDHAHDFYSLIPSTIPFNLMSSSLPSRPPRMNSFSPHPFLVTAFNIHRLLLTSMLVTCKFVDDASIANSIFALIGGVRLQELNQLEIEFLQMKNYNVFITYQQFRHFYDDCINSSHMHIEGRCLEQWSGHSLAEKYEEEEDDQHQHQSAAAALKIDYDDADERKKGFDDDIEEDKRESMMTNPFAAHRGRSNGVKQIHPIRSSTAAQQLSHTFQQLQLRPPSQSAAALPFNSSISMPPLLPALHPASLHSHPLLQPHASASTHSSLHAVTANAARPSTIALPIASSMHATTIQPPAGWMERGEVDRHLLIHQCKQQLKQLEQRKQIEFQKLIQLQQLRLIQQQQQQHQQQQRLYSHPALPQPPVSISTTTHPLPLLLFNQLYSSSNPSSSLQHLFSTSHPAHPPRPPPFAAHAAPPHSLPPSRPFPSHPSLSLSIAQPMQPSHPPSLHPSITQPTLIAQVQAPTHSPPIHAQLNYQHATQTAITNMLQAKHPIQARDIHVNMQQQSNPYQRQYGPTFMRGQQ